MTFLQAINQVMIKLREAQVSSYTESTYSLLIAGFVNDVLEEMHTTCEWDEYETTISVTQDGSGTYVLTGSNEHTVIRQVYNDTDDYVLKRVGDDFYQRQSRFAPITSGQPVMFLEAGDDSSQQRQITIYPDDGTTRTLVCNVYKPDARYSDNDSVIQLPTLPVILGAWWMAVEERGEDEGAQSGSLYRRYQKALGAAVSRNQDRKTAKETSWEVE